MIYCVYNSQRRTAFNIYFIDCSKALHHEILLRRNFITIPTFYLRYAQPIMLHQRVNSYHCYYRVITPIITWSFIWLMELLTALPMLKDTTLQV